MAVTALQPRVGARAAQPVSALALAACAAVLCFSVIAIGGWLAMAGSISGLHVLNPFHPGSVFGPLVATAYVTMIALPLTAVVGVFAAIAASEVRVFGPAAHSMRSALGLLGSIPTVVVAFAALIGASAIGWHPTLTGAALLLAAINMPLMAGLALEVLSRKSADVREAAMALGASPMFIARYVLLPRSGTRLWGATIIVATQIIGAAAAIAILTGALVPKTTGAAPLGTWPLAVDVWIHGDDIGGYGATAASALFLALVIWLLQGVARLRATPDTGRSSGAR